MYVLQLPLYYDSTTTTTSIISRNIFFFPWKVRDWKYRCNCWSTDGDVYTCNYEPSKTNIFISHIDHCPLRYRLSRSLAPTPYRVDLFSLFDQTFFFWENFMWFTSSSLKVSEGMVFFTRVPIDFFGGELKSVYTPWDSLCICLGPAMIYGGFNYVGGRHTLSFWRERPSSCCPWKMR